MEPSNRVGWRVRLVQAIADFLGVPIYAKPFAILIYDMSGDLAALHRAARAEDEAVH